MFRVSACSVSTKASACATSERSTAGLVVISLRPFPELPPLFGHLLYRLHYLLFSLLQIVRKDSRNGPAPNEFSFCGVPEVHDQGSFLVFHDTCGGRYRAGHSVTVGAPATATVDLSVQIRLPPVLPVLPAVLWPMPTYDYPLRAMYYRHLCQRG